MQPANLNLIINSEFSSTPVSSNDNRTTSGVSPTSIFSNRVLSDSIKAVDQVAQATLRLIPHSKAITELAAKGTVSILGNKEVIHTINAVFCTYQLYQHFRTVSPKVSAALAITALSNAILGWQKPFFSNDLKNLIAIQS